MVSFTQQLPLISNKDKYSLFVAMRDYYENVGRFLPNKKVDRTPTAKPIVAKRIPDDISYNEIKLWNIDHEDHAFRSNYIGNLPNYLSSYFTNKYIDLFQSKSRRAANTFLRKTLGGNIKGRLDLLNQKYEADKPSSLTIVFGAEFEKLPTYERESINKLSVDIARHINNLITQKLDESSFSLSANEVNQNSIEHKIYSLILKELNGINVTPPYYADYKNDKLTNENIIKAWAKVTNEDWWRNKLQRRRDTQKEHLAIAVGQVQAKASPYASRSCINEFNEQKRRNRKYLERMAIENEETGEQIPLDLQVYKSIANPAIRRVELMNRMRGFEDIAEEFGYCGAFITLTAPSKYHSVYSRGGFVENWIGNTPQDTQAYLCKVWSRIRAKLSREDIKVFGFRVAEPHHDGTPHWHILVFMRPEDISKAFKIMWIYAMDEDGHEKGAAKNRFEFKMIEKEKGSATGYIAKYISKNIDGYALDDAVDNESGQNLKNMAKAVTAWASRWKIRQFQQIGGAPVTVWRELRRLKDKTVDESVIDPVLASADIGDWAAYTIHQGGPMVKRKDLAVRLSYEEQLNQYEEPIKKINGVFSPIVGLTSYICTRLIKCKIIQKGQTSKALDLKNRAERTPWSSVNNCTQNFKDDADDQREEIKKQLKIIGIPDDDLAVNRLYLRESIKISQNQYLKLDNTLNGVHLIVCNSPQNRQNSTKKPLKISTFDDFEFSF
ncbi:replication endonuclease [Orbus sasakiae]|uniref:Replication endonuclease n=1 Tax=Orbus sasakiae TaxID=1078475 RepID=A0ABP9ND15_9GAMM